MTEAKNIILGSICVATAQVSFGFMEVLIKSTDIKIAQFMIARYVIQVILGIIWWNLFKPYQHSNKINNWYGDSPYIANIWWRGLLTSTNFITYYAINKLPLGDFQTIFYQAPLMAIFCAWLFMNEKLPNSYILIPSVIMMIVGILLVAQPHFLTMTLTADSEQAAQYQPLNIYGIIAAIASAFRWSICVLLVRKAVDSHFIQLEFASFGGFLITTPTMLILNTYYIHMNMLGNLNFDDNSQWRFDPKAIGILFFLIVWYNCLQIDSPYTAILIAFGCCGFWAIALEVIGYQLGEATMVSWLEYINIPVGFIHQITIFNDHPNGYEMIGGILVTIACLLTPLEQLFKYCMEQKMSNVRSRMSTGTVRHSDTSGDEVATDSSGQSDYDQNMYSSCI